MVKQSCYLTKENRFWYKNLTKSSKKILRKNRIKTTEICSQLSLIYILCSKMVLKVTLKLMKEKSKLGKSPNILAIAQ
jgi:hypothetical protein